MFATSWKKEKKSPKLITELLKKRKRKKNPYRSGVARKHVCSGKDIQTLLQCLNFLLHPTQSNCTTAYLWKIPCRFLNFCHCYSSWRSKPSTLSVLGHNLLIIQDLDTIRLLWAHSIRWPALSSCWKWFLPFVKS